MFEDDIHGDIQYQRLAVPSELSSEFLMDNIWAPIARGDNRSILSGYGTHIESYLVF